MHSSSRGLLTRSSLTANCSSSCQTIHAMFCCRFRIISSWNSIQPGGIVRFKCGNVVLSRHRLKRCFLKTSTPFPVVTLTAKYFRMIYFSSNRRCNSIFFRSMYESLSGSSLKDQNRWQCISDRIFLELIFFRTRDYSYSINVNSTLQLLRRTWINCSSWYIHDKQRQY